MKIKPLYDRVLIEVLEENQTLSSGLIIPDSAKKKPTKGIVKAVGSGFFKANGEHEELEIKVDQCVLFNEWAANSNEIIEDDKKFIIIKAEDVLAIIED
ncbi:MAG: 10 kDa chaperonin [Proteobacteria bacterium]|jgi:chaperonin GroES|nr:MAG: 10 kDa chaperonin [Pseudomonadota bacterium]|tara:strand:- start:3867 stop:4163 length:297 start_codon:yes stop_codon:yes gene_type:complete